MTDPTNPYAEAHRHPAGSGDARPEALQVIKDLGLMNQLTDKVVLVTGSSSGIGIETVRALYDSRLCRTPLTCNADRTYRYATGAKVLMQARNPEKGLKVLEEIQSSTPSQGSLHLIKMNLDSLQSVRDGAQAVLQQTDRLNVLVNNAGVRNTPEGRTVDGFETQFATNHLGHFLLFQLLKDLLLASSTPEFASRVVNVTSGAHYRSRLVLENPNLDGAYDPRLAYANSKTANIWMANHIERLYGSRGVHALSVHPGAILTGLQGNMDQATIDKHIAEHPNLLQALKSVQQGAATQVWAAVAPVWEGVGGKYLEDMREGHLSETPTLIAGGYKDFIFDEKSEAELWKISNQMVGFVDE